MGGNGDNVQVVNGMPTIIIGRCIYHSTQSRTTMIRKRDMNASIDGNRRSKARQTVNKLLWSTNTVYEVLCVVMMMVFDTSTDSQYVVGRSSYNRATTCMYVCVCVDLPTLI